MAAERGVRVFTVGIGTRQRRDHRRAKGWSMRVRLDEETLKTIANITRAEYFYAGHRHRSEEDLRGHEREARAGEEADRDHRARGRRRGAARDARGGPVADLVQPVALGNHAATSCSGMATVVESNDAFTAFWNDVLVAKFERFRNIMLGGLSYHSAVPLAKLQLPAVPAGRRRRVRLG